MRRVLLCGILTLASCANRTGPSVALYEKGDYAGAAADADKRLASHPDDDGLWQMRIRAALALGDGEGIAKSYATYRERRGSDDAELLRDLAIATLGQALGSPSQRMKIIAIEAVQAAEIQQLAEQVAERMGDDDDRVAATAAIAVLRGYPQAPQIASEMMRSEDPEARRIAVDGIGRKVGSLAAVDLHKAAADPDPRVRRAAFRWLAQLKDKEAPAVFERNLRHTDESVRAAAASGLARIGLGDLQAFAKKALADKSLAVRLAGVELLVTAKRTDELTQIAQSDPDPMVAAEAAIAVKRKDLAQAALDKAATAERWTIRAGAANTAVRALDKSASVAFARKLMTDTEVGVRLAAARALMASGDKAAAMAIFEQALTTDSAVSAATDLARAGDKRGLDALSNATRDAKATPDQRAQAAAAHSTARRVTPGLVAALADANGVVRAEAAAVLVALAKEPR
ncbi:MAG: HEAT repeat domain-containing protein [Myxococcota bacterium]|nr:HEAT repeat domain-containing protein [Myxococcota bacterium]